MRRGSILNVDFLPECQRIGGSLKKFWSHYHLCVPTYGSQNGKQVEKQRYYSLMQKLLVTDVATSGLFQNILEYAIFKKKACRMILMRLSKQNAFRTDCQKSRPTCPQKRYQD